MGTMSWHKDPILQRLEDLTHTLNIEDAAKEMLFALSKDVFLVVDKDDRIKYASPAFTDILGYDIRKDVIGKQWEKFLHPIEGGWSWKNIDGRKDESLGDRTISRMQVSHLSKSNKWLIIDWNCAFEPINGDWYCVGRNVGEVKEK